MCTFFPLRCLSAHLAEVMNGLGRQETLSVGEWTLLIKSPKMPVIRISNGQIIFEQIILVEVGTRQAGVLIVCIELCAMS